MSLAKHRPKPAFQAHFGKTCLVGAPPVSRNFYTKRCADNELQCLTRHCLYLALPSPPRLPHPLAARRHRDGLRARPQTTPGHPGHSGSAWAVREHQEPGGNCQWRSLTSANSDLRWAGKCTGPVIPTAKNARWRDDFSSLQTRPRLGPRSVLSRRKPWVNSCNRRGQSSTKRKEEALAGLPPWPRDQNSSLSLPGTVSTALFNMACGNAP